MSTIRPGELWLHQFDVFTKRGVEPREIVTQMAAEMDRLFALATRAIEASPQPPIIVPLCPRCGQHTP